MSANFELHLYMFLDYCYDNNDDSWSRNFKDRFPNFESESSKGYDYIYEGSYCHNRIKEIFNVN